MMRTAPLRTSSLCLGLAVAAGLLIAVPAQAQDSPLQHPERFAPGGQPGGPAAPTPDGPDREADQSVTEVPNEPEARARILEGFYERLAKSPSAEVSAPLKLAIDKLAAMSGSPTADLLLSRSITATEQGKYELAIRLLDVALEQQPDFAEGFARRALVYYQRGETQRALGDLRRALALNPRHMKALEGLGSILSAIGEKKPALEAFKKLLAIDPHDKGARQASDELKAAVEGQGI